MNSSGYRLPQPNLWILRTMCGKFCPSLWCHWGLEVGPIGFLKGAKHPQPLPLSPFIFKPPPGGQVPATCSLHNSDLPDAQSNGANHDRGRRPCPSATCHPCEFPQDTEYQHTQILKVKWNKKKN